MHVIRIGIDDLVVVPAIAHVREDVSASSCNGFDGMALEDPVADVDNVDVLLHQDVARKHAVPEPIA